MMEFDVFKQQIKKAAHQYHSCVKGYREMMEASNYTEMLNVMKDNWDWVYDGGFYLLFRDNFADWYDGHKEQFDRANVYFNADSDHGIVFVSLPEKPINISGDAKAFVLNPSYVDVCGHGEIHCRAEGSQIRLYDNAYGTIDKGVCECHGYSQAVSKSKVTTYDHSKAFVDNGIVYDCGHDLIRATGKSIVYTNNPYHVTIEGESEIKPNPLIK